MTQAPVQPDILGAVLTLLKASPVVTAVVPANMIFGARLDEERARPMPRPAVVVNRAGGWPGPGGRSYLTTVAQRLDIRCYGETDQKAAEVYRNVHSVLKYFTPKTVAGVRIYSFMTEVSGVNLLEPEVNWPVAFGSYSVTFNEIAA